MDRAEAATLSDELKAILDAEAEKIAARIRAILGEAERELALTRAQRDAAVAELKRIQWRRVAKQVDTGGTVTEWDVYCVSCYKVNEHKPDCRLVAALKLAEEAS